LKMESGEEWEDTATNLLEKLNPLATEAMQRQKSWPKDGKGLSNTLRRLAPNLRESGIQVEFSREGHTRRRLITIRKGTESSVPVVPSVPTVRETGESGDAGSPGRTQTSSPDDSHRPPIYAQGDDRNDGDDGLHTQSKSPRHSQYLYSEEL
jgi:hypothetical protein